MMKGKAIGTYDKKSGKISFQEWNLPALDKHIEAYQTMVQGALREGFEIATAKYECSAWLPIEWGDSDGIGSSDPDLVYVEIPLGADEDLEPRWSFRLSEMINSIIELHELGGIDGGGPIQSEDRHIFIAVRDHLRLLADRLDGALLRPEVP